MNCPQLWNVVSVLLVAPLTVSAAEPIKLPVPPGWRVENTAYPPAWAKTLPWKGTLQLRFPKPFFDSDSPYFWSYPILYQLEGNAIVNDNQLRRALLEYDAGLYGGRYPREKIRMEVAKEKADDKYPVIIVDGYDPFTTRKPLRTWIVIHRRYDKASDRTIMLLLRSARPYHADDEVWQTLTKLFRKQAGF